MRCRDRIQLARMDERQKAMRRESEIREAFHKEERAFAAAELARRLDILNHADQEAIRVKGTSVLREVYDRDKAASDLRDRTQETQSANLKGQLWLPLVLVAALAAGLGAALVRWLIP